MGVVFNIRIDIVTKSHWLSLILLMHFVQGHLLRVLVMSRLLLLHLTLQLRTNVSVLLFDSGVLMLDAFFAKLALGLLVDPLLNLVRVMFVGLRMYLVFHGTEGHLLNL